MALNTFYLDRVVRNRNNPAILASQQLCSPEYDGSFLLLLSVLLTSVAMLVFKLTRLRSLPELWVEHERLLIEHAALATETDRIERLLAAAASAGADVSVHVHVDASLRGDVTPAESDQHADLIRSTELQQLRIELLAAPSAQPTTLLYD